MWGKLIAVKNADGDKGYNKVKKVVSNVKEDIKNYDKNNESKEIVFESNCFSAYKGKTVIKTSFDSSFSFGIIGLSTDQDTSNNPWEAEADTLGNVNREYYYPCLPEGESPGLAELFKLFFN